MKIWWMYDGREQFKKIIVLVSLKKARKKNMFCVAAYFLNEDA